MTLVLSCLIIAGIPPQYGLYTAIVMTAVGALFDSSKQLINGPTNAISIALLSALAAVPPDDRLPTAILLAFLVGLVQTGITLLRFGDLSRYISQAVIVGFTLGAGVVCWFRRADRRTREQLRQARTANPGTFGMGAGPSDGDELGEMIG